MEVSYDATDKRFIIDLFQLSEGIRNQ